MIVTKKHLSRRTVLRGLGATIALPFLDAMVPALAGAQTAANPVPRLGFFYVPNGMYLPNFHPAGNGGTNFALTPTLKVKRRGYPAEPLVMSHPTCADSERTVSSIISAGTPAFFAASLICSREMGLAGSMYGQ